ncbi:hypothetical protein OIO90_002011 [Microbotryomycetes sp. JL221]|nr:hypothetical protein OIO90_002011 [Microbotryomycetes sp. JL221]
MASGRSSMSSNLTGMQTHGLNRSSTTLITPRLTALSDPPQRFLDVHAMEHFMAEVVRRLIDSERAARHRHDEQERIIEADLLSFKTSTLSLRDRHERKRSTATASTAKTQSTPESDLTVRARLDLMGFKVGWVLAERLARDRSRFPATAAPVSINAQVTPAAPAPIPDALELVKFVCKDVWIALYDKQVDNLRTNHRGVYVLHDNSFRPLRKLSSTGDDTEYVRMINFFLAYPTGIVRGALANLGIQCTVTAECAGSHQAVLLLPKALSECREMAPRSTRPPSTVVHTLTSHKGPVNCCVYNSGANYFLTGGQDRTIKLWNPSSGLEIKTYSGHTYEVLGVCCAPDNTRFASCGGDKNVYLWNVATGDQLKRFQGHLAKVNSVAFNGDASILASGSFDASVRLWDIKSQQRLPIQVLEDSKDSIMSVCMSGHFVMTGSVDGNVRTYDLRQGQLRTDYFENPVTSLTLTNDSTMVLVSTLDSHLRALDLDTGKVLNTYTGHDNTNYRSQAAFGPAEAFVVIGDEKGFVYAWDTETGANTAKIKAHDRAVLWTAHHPKDAQMITASSDGKVKVWG